MNLSHVKQHKISIVYKKNIFESLNSILKLNVMKFTDKQIEEAKQREIKEANGSAQKRMSELSETLKEQSSVDEILSKWYLRQYITTATERKVKAGKLSSKELSEQILKIAQKRIQKNLHEDIILIERIFSAELPTQINVSIEWKKSRIWGANPTAKAKIWGENNTFGDFSSGSISGCGYDKESTAFAQAANQSLSLRKLLLVGYDKIKEDYGHGGGRLSGGVGTSCYYSIFKTLGYRMEKVASGKMFDAYVIKQVTP